jgi:hypothetical protein
MSKLKTILSLILISGGCQALEGAYNIEGYAGIEPKIRRMEFKRHFGNKVFKDPFYTSLNAFVGCKLNEYFGLEAGYESSDTKVNSSYGNNGLYLFGSRLLDSVNGLDRIDNFFNASSKISGSNINLMTSIPLNSAKSFQLIGSAGLAYMRSKTTCDFFEIGEKNIVLSDDTNIPVQRFSHSRSRYKDRVFTLRFRSGFQYVTEHNFGVRALASWENTHKIKIRGKDRDSGQRLNEHAKLKDSISYSVGFFVPF